MISRCKQFKVLISPFLKNKLKELEETFGKDSWEYQSIYKQYAFSNLEDYSKNVNSKHYEASVGIPNVERLYKHHMCFELTFSCSSHCRYCLRSNYDEFTVKTEDMQNAVNFMKENNLDEILITGGDPFLNPKKLRQLLEMITEQVPSMNVIRIASRTFTQNPKSVNDDIIDILQTFNAKKRIEVATQISSPIELTWTESIEAFNKILKLGIPIYAQNVFLKGINDTPEHLIKLYELMRKIGITPHYLFNCCPLKHVDHFRPSLKKMCICYEKLVNSGQVTGRSKPILALMTAIGKIILTPFNVLEYKEGEYVKLKSRYKLEDRLAYNPNWKMPEDVWVSEDGYLCIKYPDGTDY